MSTTPHNSDRFKSRRGFTLTELMVVMAIVGVLVSMSAPSFERAIEQSRANIAVANLRSIWAAERLYWLEYHTYTPSIATLQSLGVLDNAIPNDGVSALGGYQYDLSASSGTMTATAARYGASGAFSIDQAGDGSGTVTVSGFTIVPGFQ
jgi:prepilin-type N-terminal cleavage/methylation domain-containing protein